MLALGPLPLPKRVKLPTCVVQQHNPFVSHVLGAFPKPDRTKRRNFLAKRTWTGRPPTLLKCANGFVEARLRPVESSLAEASPEVVVQRYDYSDRYSDREPRGWWSYLSEEASKAVRGTLSLLPPLHYFPLYGAFAVELVLCALYPALRLPALILTVVLALAARASYQRTFNQVMYTKEASALVSGHKFNQMQLQMETSKYEAKLMHDQLSLSSLEMRRLLADNQKLQIQLLHLQRAAGEGKERRLHEQNREIRETKVELAGLRQELALAASRIQDLEQRLVSATQQATSEASKRAELADELQLSQSHLSRVLSEKQAVDTQLEDTTQQLNALLEDVAAMTRKLSEAAQLTEQLDLAASPFAEPHVSESTRVADLQHKLQEAYQQVKDLEFHHTSSQQEMVAMREHIRELELATQQLTQLQAALDLANRDEVALREHMETTVVELVDTLKSELSDVRQQLGQVKGDSQTYSRKMEEAQKESRGMRHQLRQLEETNVALLCSLMQLNTSPEGRSQVNHA